MNQCISEATGYDKEGKPVCQIKGYYDELPVSGQDFDFGDEAENNAYLERFEREELFSFMVALTPFCKCCQRMSGEKDYLGGIHAEDGTQAIEYYIEQNDFSHVHEWDILLLH